jgi:hypothetical protein
MNEAADAASAAYQTWREVPPSTRSRVMFRLRDLVEKHTEEIAKSITTEQGKTLVDARGDVFRGLGMPLPLHCTALYHPQTNLSYRQFISLPCAASLPYSNRSIDLLIINVQYHYCRGRRALVRHWNPPYGRDFGEC